MVSLDSTAADDRPMVGEKRLLELQTTHELLCRVLNPPPSAPGYRTFRKLCQRTLDEAETERWFSFDSFLELLGLAGLNQESSGGLYALHAHLNHSCEPNVQASLANEILKKNTSNSQVRNLPKSFTVPTQLPCDLPAPNGPGVRGTNRLTMLARQTIQKGEELTIPYVNFAAPRDERRQTLRENYGFWCSCPKCGRES